MECLENTNYEVGCEKEEEGAEGMGPQRLRKKQERSEGRGWQRGGRERGERGYK